MPARRLTALTVLAALALSILLTSAARAQQTTSSALQDAISALQSGPLYAEPNGPLDAAGSARVRTAIREADAGTVHIAAISKATVEAGGGSASAVGAELIRGLGRRSGTYVVLAPGTIVARSNQVDNASRLAKQAADARGGDGAEAVLTDFVERVGRARREGSGLSGGGKDGGGSGGTALLGLLALLVGGFGLVSFLKRRRARRQEQQEVEDLRREARDDLVALGDDVRAIDLDVEMPGADPRAREHLSRALELYDSAERAHDAARRPEDFEPIGSEIEEGRYHLQAAKAILAGHDEPERRPPCFFDPRHGPSTREVEWAPAGGAPRAVPACEADALRVEEGIDPTPREVMVGGNRMPYYDAPGVFRPYVGGYYSGFGGPAFGGFLPGLLFGSMIGGPWGGGFFDAGDAGGFGGGGFDGGGFGGGDFGGGGGDFGGGDFGGGGGDFGGGDF